MLHIASVGLFSLILIVQGEPIVFKNCDANGTVTSVDISPCSAQPCVFHKGTNATVKICFTAPGSSVNATAEIDGIVAGIPVKFSMPNPNGCYQSGIQCPISKGQTLCYTSTLMVLPSYPQIRLVVKWKLTGDHDVPIFCVLFPVEIDDVGRKYVKQHPLRYQPRRHRGSKQRFLDILGHGVPSQRRS